MRRLPVRLAAACAFAAAMAIFMAGAAFAGDHGNGNDNGHGRGNGQPAQTTQAQTTPAQAAQTQTQADQSSTTTATTEAQAGVKPSSSTTHWTHCKTGGTSSAATCTSSDNGHTPQTGADVSKRYGNGKTAAQIAVSRGGVGVQLTGPGNSQPHKVSDCSHKSNPSGGVDVHAVKSYSTTACASVGAQEHGSEQSSQNNGQQSEVHGKSEVHVKVEEHGKSNEHVKVEEHGKSGVHVKVETQQQSSVAASAHLHVTICHATGTPDNAGNGYVMISPSASGVYHGHYRQHGADIIPPFTYEGQTYSANWTANGQAIFNNGCRPLAAAVVPTTQAQTVTTTTTVPQVSITVPTTTETVPSTTTTTTMRATTTVTTTTESTTTVGSVAGTTTVQQQSAPATNSTTTTSAGGVKGAQTSLTPKPAKRGGVLGTVTHVAGSSLPFTGFPVWLAVLIAIALILAGFALRRRTLHT